MPGAAAGHEDAAGTQRSVGQPGGKLWIRTAAVPGRVAALEALDPEIACRSGHGCDDILGRPCKRLPSIPRCPSTSGATKSARRSNPPGLPNRTKLGHRLAVTRDDERFTGRHGVDHLGVLVTQVPLGDRLGHVDTVASNATLCYMQTRADDLEGHDAHVVR